MEKISVGQIREIADMGEEAKRRIAEALQISIISTEVYLASEVDALLADVRALVESINKWVNPKYCYDLEKAIAAVEARLVEGK